MKRNKAITAAAVAVILLMGVVLSGCGGLFGAFDCATERVTAIRFVDNVLTMQVGDTIDITSNMISVEPRFAYNKEYYIETDDVSVASVSGTKTVTAYRYGKATLRVVSASDERVTGECTLNVDYADPRLTLTPSCATGARTPGGILVLDAAGSHTVDFECSINEGVDPSVKVVWSVNGTVLPDENLLTLRYEVPAGAGEYVVKAQIADDLYDEYVIRSYGAYDVLPATAIGSLEQEETNGTFRPVTLTAAVDNADGNPEPTADWYVNGEYTYTGVTFVFVPAGPGAHDIRLNINGSPAEIEDGAGVTVRAKGRFIPQNVYVDYDNCYPDVYVRWTGPAADVTYAVTVDGRTFRSDDPAAAALFDGDSFNAGGVVDIFSGARIQVENLGDNDLYLPSDGVSVRLDAISRAAEPYLASEFYSGARNLYLTSDEEFYEMYAYMLLYRPAGVSGQNSGVTVTETVYMDYDSGYSSCMSLLDAAFSRTHFTGEYTHSIRASKVTEGEYTVKVTCYSDNNPSTFTSGRTGAGLNAVRPHVSYADERIDDVFPVDGKYPVTVSTGEELYYAAEKGFRPVPTAGSRAETLYDNARDVLTAIIPAEYQPQNPAAYTADKAHAVYDWIMWRVDYDHAATEVTEISKAVKYAAYYLEGVIGWDVAKTGDVPPLAVCDGMSKTYSLLCNILGIECVRIAGTAGSGGSWGGHAWNKVKLSEGWYNVDCTWGDAQALYGRSAFDMKAYESAVHTYLFLTDEQLRYDHREDKPNDYPVSATEPYNWYARPVTYAGGTLDFYIGSAAGAKEEIAAIAEYVLATVPDDGGMIRIGRDSMAADVYGVDILVSSHCASVVNSGYIRSALRDVSRQLDYVEVADGCGIICLQY